MGVMGSGLAHQIAERYPRVYGCYRSYLEYYGRDECFGTSQVVQVADNLSVVNLFGQYHYGRNNRHTDYNALRSALNHFYFNKTVRKLCRKNTHW